MRVHRPVARAPLDAVIGARAANLSVRTGEAGAGRSCEGCPVRRPALAAVEAVGINVLYGMINAVRPSEAHDHFTVSFRSWRTNLRRGFGWDNDPFLINQFGHPYQGGNYLVAGRSLGLSYWESLPLATLGSVTWEYFGETTRPAWNDVVNTTLGGAAFGEVLHRMAWLIRDPQRTGWARQWRELVALGLDPIAGVNRLLLGDASRIAPKPPTFDPSRLAAEMALGAQWGGSSGRLASEPARAFGAFGLRYGTFTSGPSRAPFDAFELSLRAGGGALVSEASIRGRLAEQPLLSNPEAPHRWLLVQGYDYRTTPAFLHGAQSIQGGIANRFRLAPAITVATTALAGWTVLGAIDSLQAASAGANRPFDYGTGVVGTASAALDVHGHTVARVSYRSSWLHTITRVPANHQVSVLAGEVRLPIRSGVCLGLEGERMARTTRSGGSQTERRYYPQLRAFLAWGFQR